MDGFGYKAVVKKGILSKSGAMPGLTEEKSFGFKVEKPNVITNEDFEAYENGTKLSQLNLGWSVNDSKEGDSVTIETDPKTNSKAVKITQTRQTPAKNSNPTTGFTINGSGDEINDGIVDISFKIRKENNAAFLPTNFLGDDVRTFQYSNDIYLGSFQKWAGNVKAEYTEWNITYDFVNNKIKVNDYEENKDLKAYKGINFQIAANWGDGDQSWFTGTENYTPVYWVDDIKVTKRAAEVVKITPSNNEAVGLGLKKITVQFNEEILDKYLTNDYFQISQNGEVISNYTITKNKDDKTTVEICGEFSLNKKYTVTVKQGIKSTNTAVLGLLEDFVSSFETEIDTTRKIATDNFDSYENGTKLSEIHSDWNVSDSHTGDSVTIETDTQTNQKALKIVQKKQEYANGYNTGFRVDLGKKTNGVYRVSMKIKAQSASSVLDKGMLLSTGYVVGLLQQYHRSLYVDKLLDNLYVNEIGKDTYTDIEFIIDVDNKKYKVLTNSGMKEYDFMSGYTDFTGVQVMLTAKDGSGSGDWLPNEGEESVYWIDDFCVEQVNMPEVKWSKPANKASNVVPTNTIELNLTEATEVSSVNKENVKVFKNDVQIDKYTVSLVDYTKILVTMEEIMDKNSEYKVAVNNLKTAGSEFGMNKENSISFKTCDKFGLDIFKVYRKPGDDDKFSLTYDFYNADIDGKLDLGFASYDENGKLLSTVIEKSSVAKGEKAYGTVDLIVGAKACCFIWNDFEKMLPVAEPVIIEIPKVTTYGADIINNTTDDVTIAFIGGSITAQEQWITPLRTYFNNKFTGRKVNYVVAGVGGTGSELQTYRVYEDIVKHSPDLVFVDATINDSPLGSACANTYESVIRQLLNASHQPAIISVAFGSKESLDGNNLWPKTFESQKTVNEYYGVATINVHGYVAEKIDNGELAWKNDGSGKIAVTNDNVHPNAQGGAIYAEYITKMLDNDWNTYIKRANQNKEPHNKGSDNYMESRMISWREAEFTGDWTEGTNTSWLFHDGSAETSTDGSSVTLEFFGKSIAIYNNGGKNGMDIAYDLDNGAKTGTVSSFKNSWDWNQAGATSAITADEEGVHTITFTARDPQTEAPALIFGYFLIR